jgi:hypothetical protein
MWLKWQAITGLDAIENLFTKPSFAYMQDLRD